MQGFSIYIYTHACTIYLYSVVNVYCVYRCYFDDDLVKSILRHGEVRGSSDVKYVYLYSVAWHQ